VPLAAGEPASASDIAAAVLHCKVESDELQQDLAAVLGDLKVRACTRQPARARACAREEGKRVCRARAEPARPDARAPIAPPLRAPAVAPRARTQAALDASFSAFAQGVHEHVGGLQLGASAALFNAHDSAMQLAVMQQNIVHLLENIGAG